MDEIATFLADVFEAIDEGKSPWEKLLSRLDGYFNRRFHGTEWREQENKFWEEKTKTRYL